MKIYFVLIIIFFGLGTASVFATMSSPNYVIQSDAIDVGGADGTSSNFHSEDTIGEIASGDSGSVSYRLRTGYQSMQETYLSLSAPSDVTMTPTIPGVSGGLGNGSVFWTVTTDNLAGYSFYVRSNASPSLAKSDNPSVYFDDYTPGTNPDYVWQVDADKAEFGFTPEGSDIVQKFRDNGENTCNTGTLDTSDACWYNFVSSNPGELISQSNTSNHPAGVATTVKMEAQSNSAHLQEAGTYQATITVTALAN
ncbi:MAG: hypothetical protein COX30_01280 [Candidatus Moranbacteria bacterium CG23_combo_of_CG06-09_8_20_14_all_39_10]|nr:MAG: hypothetical protein COX30_01280 [Candidatus Moranbacteria bacterium CG23_combo_of_CG06-09_8_20_14_all_39_10]